LYESAYGIVLALRFAIKEQTGYESTYANPVEDSKQLGMDRKDTRVKDILVLKFRRIEGQN
jgi:hypothetical protein